MEKVLVVRTQEIKLLLGNDCFIVRNIDEIINFIKQSHIYVDRGYAEYAVEYKQIIPYTILTDGSKIFLTKRLKAQTEKRLHGKCSIGLGGHINPSEENYEDVIYGGMKRELLEEVGVDHIFKQKCVGIINDGSTEVSDFHIGLVFFLHVSPEVSVKETQKMIGGWADEKDISECYECLESWSQIVWDNRTLWMK